MIYACALLGDLYETSTTSTYYTTKIFVYHIFLVIRFIVSDLCAMLDIVLITAVLY